MALFSIDRFRKDRHPDFDLFPDGSMVKHKTGGPIMCVSEQREFGAVCSYWLESSQVFVAYLFCYDEITKVEAN